MSTHPHTHAVGRPCGPNLSPNPTLTLTLTLTSALTLTLTLALALTLPYTNPNPNPHPAPTHSLTQLDDPADRVMFLLKGCVMSQAAVNLEGDMLGTDAIYNPRATTSRG